MAAPHDGPRRLLQDRPGWRDRWGIIVLRKGIREYELGRIFVDPDHQNQGIGAQAFQFLWQQYPLAKRWTLGTPRWNVRTRHFYKKVGFVEIGADGYGGILFERRMTRDSAP